MGFTIDMVSGNISNITNGIDLEKIETVAPITSSIKRGDLLQEQLLPVADTTAIKSNSSIPSVLVNCDVDLFIEDVSQ